MRNRIPTSRMVKLVLSACVAIAIMIAIYMMSAQNGDDSGSLSGSFSRIIASLLISGFDYMSEARQQELIDFLVPSIRKLAHGTEYACLSISLLSTFWQAHALRCSGKPETRSLLRQLAVIACIALLFTFAYACTDELHQLFIDGRSGKFADVLVDMCGASIGLLVSTLVSYWFLRKRATSTR